MAPLPEKGVYSNASVHKEMINYGNDDRDYICHDYVSVLTTTCLARMVMTIAEMVMAIKVYLGTKFPVCYILPALSYT